MKIKRVSERIKRNNLRTAAFANDIQISAYFESNADIVAMRKPFTKEFNNHYNNGFRYYLSGDWEKARKEFE